MLKYKHYFNQPTSFIVSFYFFDFDFWKEIKLIKVQYCIAVSKPVYKDRDEDTGTEWIVSADKHYGFF